MKAQKFALLAFIALLLLTHMAAVVRAQDSDGSEADSSAQTGSASNPDQAQAEKNAAASLAKEDRKKAAKQKKRTMESCLTLVRSFYSGQDAMVQAFIESHPTLDKSRLLSKILSQMMIKCNGEISDSQINYLQNFKLKPVDVDYSKSGYAELIAIDWEALKFVSANPDEPAAEDEGTGPVDMSP